MTAIAALFIGATLTSTNVGFSARVLSNLKRLDTKESQIILSAAIIDDVIGLIILSIVSGIGAAGIVSFVSIEKRLLVIIGFFILVLLTGSLMVKPLFNLVARAKTEGAVITIAFCFLLFMAYYANYVGMIPRGVVGLICAQVGLSTTILTQKTFTALVITIMVTILITPPMLKYILKNTIS